MDIFQFNIFSFSCLRVFLGAAGRVTMAGRVNMPAADHCPLMAASVSVTSSSPSQQRSVRGMFTRPAMVTRPATSQNTRRHLKLKILYENKFKAVQQNLSCVLCECSWANEFISQLLHGSFSSYPTWSFPCWLYGLPRCDPCSQGSHNVTTWKKAPPPAQKKP